MVILLDDDNDKNRIYDNYGHDNDRQQTNKKQLMNVSKKVSVTCLVMEIMIIPTITLIAVIQMNIGW